jgi:hypothetical protein
MSFRRTWMGTSEENAFRAATGVERIAPRMALAAMF